MAFVRAQTSQTSSKSSDGSEDLYVHAKALSAVPGGVLQAGDKVEYRVAVFNERPRAKDVRVLKRA